MANFRRGDVHRAEGWFDPAPSIDYKIAVLPEIKSMKTLGIIALVLFATGCAPMGTGTAQSNALSFDAATSPQSVTPFPPQKNPSTTPRMVVLATGVPPIVGIPAGGNLYIPATGGPPIVGMPTAP
jgi:hypothetical protein